MQAVLHVLNDTGDVRSNDDNYNVYIDPAPTAQVSVRQICFNCAQVSRLSECVGALHSECATLAAQYPDVTSLAAVVRACAQMRQLSSRAPLMLLAEHVQQLLLLTDEWSRRLAARADRLLDSRRALLDMLVDWRREQTRTWRATLEHMQANLRRDALLAARPLFEMSIDVTKGTRSSSQLIAAAMQWMQASSVGDHRARLNTLSMCALVCGQETETAAQLTCMCRYYDTCYTLSVDERREQLTAPTRRALADLQRIARYDAASAYSVRASAQRVHNQLFRLLRANLVCAHR
jgi:midasin (ATPase involved in ribosome maturation)